VAFRTGPPTANRFNIRSTRGIKQRCKKNSEAHQHPASDIP
jgi:hypothetical protein